MTLNETTLRRLSIMYCSVCLTLNGFMNAVFFVNGNHNDKHVFLWVWVSKAFLSKNIENGLHLGTRQSSSGVYMMCFSTNRQYFSSDNDGRKIFIPNLQNCDSPGLFVQRVLLNYLYNNFTTMEVCWLVQNLSTWWHCTYNCA